MTNKFASLIAVLIILFSFVSPALAATHAATAVTNQEVYKHELLTAARSNIADINIISEGTPVTLVLRSGVTKQVKMPKGALEPLVRHALQAQADARSAANKASGAVKPVVRAAPSANIARPAANLSAAVAMQSAESVSERVAKAAALSKKVKQVSVELSHIRAEIQRQLASYVSAVSKRVTDFLTKQQAVADRNAQVTVMSRVDEWFAERSPRELIAIWVSYALLLGAIAYCAIRYEALDARLWGPGYIKEFWRRVTALESRNIVQRENEMLASGDRQPTPISYLSPTHLTTAFRRRFLPTD